jgi:hypothetical protein
MVALALAALSLVLPSCETSRPAGPEPFIREFPLFPVAAVSSTDDSLFPRELRP